MLISKFYHFIFSKHKSTVTSGDTNSRHSSTYQVKKPQNRILGTETLEAIAAVAQFTLCFHTYKALGFRGISCWFESTWMQPSTPSLPTALHALRPAALQIQLVFKAGTKSLTQITRATHKWQSVTTGGSNNKRVREWEKVGAPLLICLQINLKWSQNYTLKLHICNERYSHFSIYVKPVSRRLLIFSSYYYKHPECCHSKFFYMFTVNPARFPAIWKCYCRYSLDLSTAKNYF